MKRAGWSLVLIAVSTPLAAQQMGMPMEELAIRVTADSGVPEIPFELVNHHIILPVQVNGSGPFRAVLDTGMPAGGLVLYGGPRVDALDLPYDDRMQAAVGGAGGDGKRITARLVPGQTLSMTGVELGGAMLTVLPPLPEFASYHEAIIGASLFRNFVVEIDHDAGVVRLHDKESYQPPEGAALCGLTFQHGIPYTTATVRTAAGKKVPVKLVVDLGASHPVSLNTDSDEAILVPPGALATVIGRGLSGDLEGHVGRVAALDLSGLELQNVVATFPESAHQSPRGMDSRNGNLGNGVLSRFNVAFDYSRERMVLVPNRKFAEPFEHDMSGLILREREGVVRVERVLPDTPAAQAGLRPDDVLLSIDGQDAGALGLPAIQERLKGDGAEVQLHYRREASEADAQLTLRRLV